MTTERPGSVETKPAEPTPTLEAEPMRTLAAARARVETARRSLARVGVAGADAAVSHAVSILLFVMLVWAGTGIVGDGLGLQNLFRDDPELNYRDTFYPEHFGLIDMPYRNSPSFWSPFFLLGFAGFLAVSIYVRASVERAGAGRRDIRASVAEYFAEAPKKRRARALRRTFQWAFCLYLLATVSASVWIWASWRTSAGQESGDFTLMTGLWAQTLAPAGDPRAPGWGVLFRGLLGFVSGAVVLALFVWAGEALAGRLWRVFNAKQDGNRGWVYLFFVNPYFLAQIAPFLIFGLLLILAFSVILPAMVMISAVAMVAIALAIGARMAPATRVTGILAVILAAILLNGAKGKLSYQGLETAGYSGVVNDDKAKVPADCPPEKTRADQANETDPADEAAREGCYEPVELLESLEKWKAQTGRPEEPVLVIIASQGGAYRASYWTALVLDALAAEAKDAALRQEIPPGAEPAGLEAFPKAIRFLTGASGGMVGLAYLGACFETWSDGAVPNVLERVMRGDPRPTQHRANASVSEAIEPAPASDGGPREILHACAPDGVPLLEPRSIAYKTRFPLPGDALSPVTFQLLARDLPSIFWPGRVSDDRGKALEAQWRALNRSFSALADGERNGTRPSLIFSPLLVESAQPMLISNLDLTRFADGPSGRAEIFFSGFPRAWSTFSVAEAARMASSFPFVSPAIAIPAPTKGAKEADGVRTVLSQRVVDAGYFDNYGLDAAVRLLADAEVRKFIETQTKGVVLLQLRAFPSAAEAELEPPSALGNAFHWLTSPFEGAAAVQFSTNGLRGDAPLELLELQYGDKFTSIVIDNQLGANEVSLNWYLTGEELDCLRAALPAALYAPDPRNRVGEDGPPLSAIDALSLALGGSAVGGGAQAAFLSGGPSATDAPRSCAEAMSSRR